MYPLNIKSAEFDIVHTWFLVASAPIFMLLNIILIHFSLITYSMFYLLHS